MTNEETVLALECLKMKLETEKLSAEATVKQYEALGKFLPLFIPEIKGFLVGNKALTPQVDLALTKEDLTFFANKCNKEKLEDIIKNLTEILESKE